MELDTSRAEVTHAPRVRNRRADRGHAEGEPPSIEASLA
jgi:hypothetical protein